MRSSRLVLSLLILVSSRAWVAGMEPDVRRAVPPGTALVIELSDLGAGLQNRLVKDVWHIASGDAAAPPEKPSRWTKRLRQAGKFLEKSLDVDSKTAISRLTSGGVVMALQPTTDADAPPDVTVFVTSDEEQTLRRFLDAVLTELRRQSENNRDQAPTRQVAPELLVVKPHGVFTCYQFGNGYFAASGRRFVAANRQSVLESALDRLSDSEAHPTFNPPAMLELTDPSGRKPFALATFNLKLFRERPWLAKLLESSSDDPIRTALWGGYFDLLGRAEYAAAGMFLEENVAQIQLRLPVGLAGAPAGFQGFFAGGASQSAFPLLRPPATFVSYSWYRDYGRMWAERSGLFSAERVVELENANARQQMQSGGTGFADLFRLLGPHWRFVAARQQAVVYRTANGERLPGFGLAVDLPDEQKFRDQVLSVLDRQVDGGMLSILGEVQAADYKGAKLTALRFHERPAREAEAGKPQSMYHFNPAYAVTRRHLVIGSTAEIVRGIIDELDHDTATDIHLARTTSEADISLSRLAEVLKNHQPGWLRRLLSPRDASKADIQRDWETANKVLTRLGQVSVQSRIEPQRFDLKVRVGPPAEAPTQDGEAP